MTPLPEPSTDSTPTATIAAPSDWWEPQDAADAGFEPYHDRLAEWFDEFPTDDADDDRFAGSFMGDARRVVAELAKRMWAADAVAPAGETAVEGGGVPVHQPPAPCTHETVGVLHSERASDDEELRRTEWCESCGAWRSIWHSGTVTRWISPGAAEGGGEPT